MLPISQCKVIKPTECTVEQPIVTHQIKSYLAVHEGAQQNLVEVFEPTEGKVFVELKFKGTGCGVLSGTPVPVDGSVYGELVPKETEAQESLLSFPLSPVEKVKHEGVETKVGLTAAGVLATFSGAYSARLATSEPFGVFLN